MREVRDEPLLGVEDLGADRDGEHGVLPVGAVRHPAAAPAALARAHPLVRPDAGEVTAPRVGVEDDVAALAAVAAVRAALRHELLAPEVDRPVATAAGDHGDVGVVVEHRRDNIRDLSGECPDAGGGPESAPCVP